MSRYTSGDTYLSDNFPNSLIFAPFAPALTKVFGIFLKPSGIFSGNTLVGKITSSPILVISS